MADINLDNPEMPSPNLLAPRTSAFIAGLIGIGVCVIGWLLCGQASRDAFYRSWLYSWFFFFGLTLGCGGWVMIHHLCGGGWGRAIQRVAEAGSLNVPLMVILFIPIVIGLKSQYPWADANLVAHDPVLLHKSAYENPGFWIVRSLIYFGIWIVIPWSLVLLQRRDDHTPNPRTRLTLRRISALGLVLYVYLMTLAGVDWIMSREAHWSSNVFGFILVVGQSLTAINFCVIVLTLLLKYEPLKSFVTRGHYNDLGNLMLTTIILWAYMNLAQFLISWMGAIQDDVKYYYSRWTLWYGILAIVLHFFIPFFTLLSKDFKRRPEKLIWLAVFIFIVHLLDIWMMVWPSNEPKDPSWMRFLLNVAAPIGIGGLWLGMFLWYLSRRPLLASRGHTEPSESLEDMSDPEVGPHGERHAHPA